MLSFLLNTYYATVSGHHAANFQVVAANRLWNHVLTADQRAVYTAEYVKAEAEKQLKSQQTQLTTRAHTQTEGVKRLLTEAKAVTKRTLHTHNLDLIWAAYDHATGERSIVGTDDLMQRFSINVGKVFDEYQAKYDESKCHFYSSQ